MRVIPALAILPSVPLLLGGVAVAGARGPGIRGAGPAGLALVAVVPVVPVAVLVVWVALLGVPVAARVAWVVPVALMVPAVAQAGPRLPQGVAGAVPAWTARWFRRCRRWWHLVPASLWCCSAAVRKWCECR